MHEDETLQDPLVRAVVIARGLRETFGLDRQNVAYLVNRWRARHEIPVPPQRLELAVHMVFTDPPPAPLTTGQADALVEAAVEDFSDTPEAGRTALRAYCARRGGVTPTEVQKIVERFLVAARAQREGARHAA
jgi:hypothetical protein